MNCFSINKKRQFSVENCSFLMAGVVRIELTTRVLETAALPAELCPCAAALLFFIRDLLCILFINFLKGMKIGKLSQHR